MTLTRNFAATLKLRSYFSSPPAYHLTNQPLQQPPPPYWVVVTSRHEPPPPPPPLLTWLCFSFYQVASFPCIASPISLSRLGSTKGIPRLGLLYPLKRFSRTLMKKASPPPWDSRYYSTTSSSLPDLFILQPPLLNSAYFLLYPIYKYHLHFVPPFPRVLGTKWRENLRDGVFF